MSNFFDLSKTRFIIVFLGALIIIHSLALFIYLHQHQSTLKAAGRDAAIQQVMNIIHMVQATPIGQLPQAIKSINSPDLSIQLSDSPEYDLKVKDLSFWRINKLTSNETHRIKLSLYVPVGLWVNLNATIAGNPLWPQFVLLVIEVIVVSILLFYTWSINRFTKPLKDFQIAAQRLGIDTKTTPLQDYKGPIIVRETAQAMNKMQQRIKDLIDDRTLLLAAISHDLRTPITRLKLRANLIQDEQIYNKTISDLDEMQSMIEEILVFLGSHHGNEDKKKIDLNSFLQTICDEFSDLGADVDFKTNNKRIPLLARPLALKRALSNLIHNAIKYGNSAVIRISASPITITIDDQGPGIPESEMEKVFSPFYRCDRSRSRKIAGTGLGLALAKDAIRSHNGEIYLENRKQGGLRVKIIF